MPVVKRPIRWTITASAFLLWPMLSLAQTSTLEVFKYEDRNSNSSRDAAEPGLNGWSISVFDNSDASNPVEIGTGITADRTLSDGSMEPGWVSFDLPEGEYLICETLPTDGEWLNTSDLCQRVNIPAPSAPELGPETATISAGGASYQIDFVEQQGEIWTYRITELNGTDLASWGFSALDSCLDEVVSVEPAAFVDFVFGGIIWDTPDLDGSGEFSITLDGVYEQGSATVDASSATGFGSAEIRGPSCERNRVVAFGNTRPVANLIIEKYADLNQNGSRDTDEPGLNGWEFSVADSSDTIVAVESSATTPDGDDGVVILRLPPGDYEVCETTQTAWINTEPGADPACQLVTLAEDDAVVDEPGFEFGFTVLPDFTAELISRVGGTWTYRAGATGAIDIDHWNLGIASCLDNIVATSPADATLGVDNSVGGFEGVRWTLGPGFGTGNFSITLDADYPSTTVELLANTDGTFDTDTIIGPNCAVAPRGETRLSFGNFFDAANAPPGAKHAAVVLDRTGSMMNFRSTGNTRCGDALELAKTDVQSFFLANPEAEGSSLAVYVFGAMGVVNLTGGFVDQASALGALDQLSPIGCVGFTPLADALCEASDTLAQTFPSSEAGDLLLAVSSDGGENASAGICAGPYSGAAAPPYTPGSWQNRVFEKLSAQSVVDVRYWDDFASVTRRAAKIAGDPPAPVAGSGGLKMATDLGFFQALADATGGDFERLSDGIQRPTVRPPVAIPTLSTAAMVVVLCLLALSGLLALRRRS